MAVMAVLQEAYNLMRLVDMFSRSSCKIAHETHRSTVRASSVLAVGTVRSRCASENVRTNQQYQLTCEYRLISCVYCSTIHTIHSKQKNLHYSLTTVYLALPQSILSRMRSHFCGTPMMARRLAIFDVATLG